MQLLNSVGQELALVKVDGEFFLFRYYFPRTKKCVNVFVCTHTHACVYVHARVCLCVCALVCVCAHACSHFPFF